MDDRGWMIEDVRDVPGVRSVLVLSADGLVMTHTGDLSKDQADTVAAACAGLYSLSASLAGEIARGSVKQLFVEFGDAGGFLFVQQAGPGSRLVVLADADVVPGLVAQSMAAQVQRIGRGLAAAPRGDAGT